MSQGFVPAENPCCGIFSVAEAVCLPFETVWSAAKVVTAKKASWRGRTYLSDRLLVLEKLGATYSSKNSMIGLFLIEAAFLAVIDEERLIFGNECNYIFDINGHSLAFKNGKFIDQCGNYLPTEYNRRFHRIINATKVYPIENFDEDNFYENLIFG